MISLLTTLSASRLWIYLNAQDVREEVILLALWVEREFGKKPGPTDVKKSEVQDLVECLDKVRLHSVILRSSR